MRNIEKRQDKRVNKHLLIYIHENPIELLGVTTNISKYGMYVECVNMLPLNHEVSLLVAGEKDNFPIKGEIIWLKDGHERTTHAVPTGMGIKIIEASEDYWNFLEFLKRKSR